MLWINFSIKNCLSQPSVVLKVKSPFVFAMWRIKSFSPSIDSIQSLNLQNKYLAFLFE